MGVEEGNREAIGLAVGMDVVIVVVGSVKGTAVGIVGTLESLAGWW